MYPSLNLAQAVMIYAYELSKMNGTDDPEKYSNKEGLFALKEKLKTVLTETGFRENSNIFPRFLERINFLNDDDIHLLHSFCNRYLKNKK